MALQILETVVYEYEYSVSHGLMSNAAGCMSHIKRTLDGYLRRFDLTDPEGMLHDACIAFARGRVEIPFINFLPDFMEAHNRRHGLSGVNEIKRPEERDAAIYGQAVMYNGPESFKTRGFVSRPADLAIGYVSHAERSTAALGDPNGAKDPECMGGVEDLEGQTDEELDALVDSILGF